ncbi:30S ribosome-binding factor RbfA [Aureibacter tunicatorum]|uniref:Ribosome-binding factor A n=1 Tax=Aureibacter tunicatorum TaxID=866807 RepID=A0AAE4BRC8_9BACT|nr:30S ribosome-binding factor RbfA [Aureibacter tunicatorum]MDR6237640.1 ribosome-binding factor A [Aureibacter tunicatorum]BDD02675.1 ribosome-binding factor A [Aureibacter tunicatorum]
MESKRQQKFSKLIQKDLSEIFQRQTKHLFGSMFITVSEVKMSPDLSFAKVYLSFMLAKTPEENIKLINQHKPEIRKFLGNKIAKQVRIVPELAFFLDTTLDNASRIENLLNDIEIPNDDKINPDDYSRDID